MSDEVVVAPVVEVKAIEIKLDGSFLVVSVDSNKDGEKLLELKIDLGEGADEAFSAFKKKSAPAV